MLNTFALTLNTADERDAEKQIPPKNLCFDIYMYLTELV